MADRREGNSSLRAVLSRKYTAFVNSVHKKVVDFLPLHIHLRTHIAHDQNGHHNHIEVRRPSSVGGLGEAHVRSGGSRDYTLVGITLQLS